MANSTVLAQHVVGAASQGLGFRGVLGLGPTASWLEWLCKALSSEGAPFCSLLESSPLRFNLLGEWFSVSGQGQGQPLVSVFPHSRLL